MKFGTVAIIGRPNAGKSTLLNALVGQKVAIVSNKPQTTRHNILGILTRPHSQIVFVDTPGIHRPGYELNRKMMQMMRRAIEDVDVLILIVDATTRRGSGDRYALNLVRESKLPVILLLNKIDRIREKTRLLEIIKHFSEQHPFEEIVPISALREDGVERLLLAIEERLREGERSFPEDQVTDQSVRHLSAEIVREKVLELTTEELPYVTAVVVDRFVEEERLVRIAATIFVERSSQKAIVIGKLGGRLKEIGTRARIEIEAMIEKKVFLELVVRVKPHWRNDEELVERMVRET